MRQINLLKPTVTMRARTPGRRSTDYGGTVHTHDGMASFTVDNGAWKLVLGAALASPLTWLLCHMVYA